MTNLPYPVLSELKKRFLEAKNVAIFAHKNPDGDSLGASLATSLVLDNLGIKNTLFCVDTPSQTFAYLPKINYFHKDFSPQEFDLLFLPDIGDINQSRYSEENFDLKKCVRIDHHPTGNFAPKCQWVESTFAATCQMMTEFFQFCKWEITPAIATCLLTGIYTDTGSFQHSNTTSQVLRTANFLYRKGASQRVLAKSIFQTNPISTLKLWGKVLSRIERDNRGVVFSAVKASDYLEAGAKREELSGVVDYLNAVEGKYSVLLTEEETNVKASLRTKSDEIDVAQIAKSFGGGGHVKAAGFTIPGHLKAETRWVVVNPDETIDPVAKSEEVNAS